LINASQRCATWAPNPSNVTFEIAYTAPGDRSYRPTSVASIQGTGDEIVCTDFDRSKQEPVYAVVASATP